MIRMCKRYILGVILFLGWHNNNYSMNLLRPYDVLIRPPTIPNETVQLYGMGEKGFSSSSFSECGRVQSSLNIWHNAENIVDMLKGFDSKSRQQKLLDKINIDSSDERAFIQGCGNLQIDFAVACALRYFFCETWSVNIYLPFYQMQLEYILFSLMVQENDTNPDSQTARIRRLLTDNLAENIKNLGCGLDITGWKRRGLGDTTLLIEWFRNFEQPKPLLKNVYIHWFAGLVLPTAERADEDKLLAFSFGYDGSFALPFGLGLELLYGDYLKLGLDIELVHVFGNTRVRRIKTHVDQTELFLLQKAETYKDPGLTQRFSLYTEFFHWVPGFSCKVGYEFLKYGQDELWVKSNDFSSEIANTAQKLDDRTMHQIYINAAYDCTPHFDDDSTAKPYVSLFMRLPFNGKRTVLEKTVGIVFALDF